MRIRQRIARRARQGFTMMETLGVVAILTIVAIIAVPNVVQMQKSMRITELDAKAQQIYNAAQYNLTSLESTNQLWKLVYKAPEEDATEEQATLQSMSVFAGANAPVDRSSNYKTSDEYNDGHETDKDYGLYVADKSNRTVQTYLITAEDNSVTQGVTNGEFYIEFSPSTGEVYSVFYYEPGPGEIYDYNSMSQNARSSKTWRANNKVGYYGGEPLQAKRELTPPAGDINGGDEPPSPSGDPTWSDLRYKVENSEELYARVISADFENPEALSKAKISVKVEGYDKTKWKTKKTVERVYSANGGNGELQFEYIEGSKEIDIILDSMRPNMAITDTFPEFIPGTEIKITVKLLYEDKSLPDQTETVNSLYSKIENDKVEVSCLRHLNNLDLVQLLQAAGYSTYGTNQVIDIQNNYVRFYNIELQNDIEFDGRLWADDAVSKQSRAAFADTGGNPLTSFEPLAFPDTVASYKEHVFDGKDHVLKHFVIDEEGDNVGLVSESQITYQNISFLNPKVTGRDNTGVLVGKHTSGSISNVHIYTTNDDQSYVSGRDNVGGLTGYLNGSWTNPTNCSTTVDVQGRNYVGGLVGKGDSWSTPVNSYVGYRKTDSGYDADRVISVVGEGDYVGGMSGSVSRPTENNHVLADVAGGSYVGGFAGSVSSNATITNCEAGDPDGVYQCSVRASGDYVGGLVGYCSAWQSSQSFSYINEIEGRDVVGGFAGVVNGPVNSCGARGAISSSGLLVRVSVSGRDYVGGFAGWIQKNVDGCYAAVDVGRRLDADGSNYYDSADCYGGFVGYYTDGSMTNSYSSGTVVGESSVGGFIGERDTSWYSWGDYLHTLNHLYTTSNVSGKRRVGGFIGYNHSNNKGNSHYLASYGKVTNLDGNGDANSIGGFVGETGISFHTGFLNGGIDADYLAFKGYNQFKKTDSYQPNDAYDFAHFKNMSHSPSVSKTYPFSQNRQGEAFPYDGVSYNGTVLPHYGDWYNGE